MATPETFRALLASGPNPQRLDCAHRTKNLCENLNEFLYKLAHEPTLAGYRIQEHVHKTVPALNRDQAEAARVTRKLDGVMSDLDYTAEFLNKLDESILISVQTREIVSELASKISSASSRMSKTNRSG